VAAAIRLPHHCPPGSFDFLMLRMLTAEWTKFAYTKLILIFLFVSCGRIITVLTN